MVAAGVIRRIDETKSALCGGQKRVDTHCVLVL